MTCIHDPNLVKLGRRPKRLNMRTPRMASYLPSAVLPKVPTTIRYGQSVSDWQMFLNDQIGDCTAAAMARAFMLWNAQWVRSIVPGNIDVQDLYVAVTGLEGAAYNPQTGLNDNGCVEADVLAYVLKNGFAKRTLDAFAYVSPKDLLLVKATIWLFGCAYVGVDLPVSAQNQQIWDVADPKLEGDSAIGSWGGHAMLLTGYDDSAGKFYGVPWNEEKEITYNWWTAYGDEAYGLLSPDWLGEGMLSPADFNKAQLLQDIKLI